MARKLLNDLNIDELLGMRNSGMTNMDIANALDISYASVYRLIGKQPASMRASSHTADLPPSIPPSNQVSSDGAAHEPEAALIVEDRVLQLVGLFASYRVRVKDKDAFDDVENTYKNKLSTISHILTNINNQIAASEYSGITVKGHLK